MNKLQTIIKDSGLSTKQAKPLLENFGDYFVQAHKLVTAGKSIKVTDISQEDEMQQAREVRLALKEVRVKANDTRKVLKADYLRGGNAVQSIFNDIKEITKPMEDYLLDQEKFAKRLQAEKDNKIEAQRHTNLSKYTDDADIQSLHPQNLSTDSFNKLLETYKFAFEAKKKAEADAEKERLEKIEVGKKERAIMEKENERLLAESKKRDVEEAKVRALENEKLATERVRRAKLEAKIKKDREIADRTKKAHEAEIRAKEELKRKALLAPDKEKLLKLVQTISSIHLPALSGKKANDICKQVTFDLTKIANELHDKAMEL